VKLIKQHTKNSPGGVCLQH